MPTLVSVGLCVRMHLFAYNIIKIGSVKCMGSQPLFEVLIVGIFFVYFISITVSGTQAASTYSMYALSYG